MIAEHHGQSSSKMCVQPTVALEPQVVGVATPKQKPKMYVQCVITNSFYFLYWLTTVYSAIHLEHINNVAKHSLKMLLVLIRYIQ